MEGVLETTARPADRSNAVLRRRDARVRGTVSIVIPAFNESAHIVDSLRETLAALGGFGLDFEIVVVDDGSHDDTYAHATRVGEEHPLRVRIIRYDANAGKGNALRLGAAAAVGQLIVFLDADMDLHPRQLPIFFETLRRRNADAVIGSKWHPDSQVEYPWLRRLYSKAYFGVVRLLFGLPVRDTQTGIKLFKASLLRDVCPRVLEKRFAFDIELLAVACRRGYRVVDAPVRLEFRRKLGRIRRGDVWGMFLDTLAIFYRMHVLRYYDREPQPLTVEAEA